MNGPRVAVEHGGPQDGALQALPDLPQNYLFPIMPPVQWIYTVDDTDTLTTEIRRAVYELAYTHGRPSLDDRGHYRYKFAGVR